MDNKSLTEGTNEDLFKILSVVGKAEHPKLSAQFTDQSVKSQVSSPQSTPSFHVKPVDYPTQPHQMFASETPLHMTT